MLKAIRRLWKIIKQLVKQHTRPTTTAIAIDSLSDLKRSRIDLIIENAMLRQQLIVLKRQVKRPQLTQGDRLRLVFLANLTRFWQHELHIVQPDTLLRWHRDLFCKYWRRKSKSHQRLSSSSNRFPDTISFGGQNAFAESYWSWGSRSANAPFRSICPKNEKKQVRPGTPSWKPMPVKPGLVTSLLFTTCSFDHCTSLWSLIFRTVELCMLPSPNHLPMNGLPSSSGKLHLGELGQSIWSVTGTRSLVHILQQPPVGSKYWRHQYVLPKQIHFVSASLVVWSENVWTTYSFYIAINSIALWRSTSITSIAPDHIKVLDSRSPMHSLNIKTDLGLSANLLEGLLIPPFWVGFITLTNGLLSRQTDLTPRLTPDYNYGHQQSNDNPFLFGWDSKISIFSASLPIGFWCNHFLVWKLRIYWYMNWGKLNKQNVKSLWTS